MSEMPEVPDEVWLAAKNARSGTVDGMLTAAWPIAGRTWLEWAAEEAEQSSEVDVATARHRIAGFLRSLAANIPTDTP